MDPNTFFRFSVIVNFKTTVITILFVSSVVSSFKHARRQTTNQRPNLGPIDGVTFLGWTDKGAIFVGNDPVPQQLGWRVCETIKYNVTGEFSHLMSLEEEHTKQVFELLKQKASDIKRLWIAHWIAKIGDKHIMMLYLRGRMVEKDVTGTDLMNDLGKARRRRAPFGREKRGKEDEENDLLARAAAVTDLTPNQVSVVNIHYPWAANWTAANKGGCSFPGCKPIKCVTTTPSCTIHTRQCTVETPDCEVVPTTPCTVVCENCTITQPECWQGNSKCEMTEDRECKVEPPNCTVITPPCDIKRQPCVTLQPPCFTEIQNHTCKMESKCEAKESQQGVTGNCTVRPRKCKPEEIEAGKTECTYRDCDPQLLCMTPMICRKKVVVCPTAKIFCPPESMHCPEPYVSCGEPNIVCTGPKYFCPKPLVSCEHPSVNCDSPKLSCPPVITKCGNPVVTCKPPHVDCPPATTVCQHNPEPCKVDPDPPSCSPPNPCETNDICGCMTLEKTGDTYKQRGAICDEQYKPLCFYTRAL